MSATEGQNSRFSVRISGHPDPAVSWFLNNIQLHESDTIKVSLKNAIMLKHTSQAIDLSV